MRLLSTAAMVFGLLSIVRSGQAATLPNPYGESPFSIDKIKPVYSEDQCDHVQGVTVTKQDPAGKVTEQRREQHCLRSMDDPNPKNFDKAVRDAAQALKNNRMKRFERIVNAWPNSMRRDLRTKALEHSKAPKTFTYKQEPYATPVDGTFETAENRFYSRPYFMNVLGEKPQETQKNKKVEVEVEAHPEVQKQRFGRRRK